MSEEHKLQHLLEKYNENNYTEEEECELCEILLLDIWNIENNIKDLIPLLKKFIKKNISNPENYIKFNDLNFNFNNQSFKHLELEISWNFHAHHYKNEINTWKRNPLQGGGAFKFYGTHLVYLLANIGKWNSVKMESFRYSLEDEYMFLISGNNKTNKFNISCNSCSVDKTIFDVNVKSSGKVIYHCNLEDPLFRNSSIREQDSRIPMLRELINSINSEKDYYELYSNLHEITKLAIDNQHINLTKYQQSK